MPRENTDPAAYCATPELEERLRRERQDALTGERYAATVARVGGIYEAWTESLQFADGKPARSLQAALDSPEEQVRRIKRRPSHPGRW